HDIRRHDGARALRPGLQIVHIDWFDRGRALHPQCDPAALPAVAAGVRVGFLGTARWWLLVVRDRPERGNRQPGERRVYADRWIDGSSALLSHRDAAHRR